MKAIKTFLLTFLLTFIFMAQVVDAKLLQFTVRGVVGPDVPRCPPEKPDPAIYPPFTDIFSVGDPMKMTFTVDMSTPGDCYDESQGNACYYNGSVVALTIEVPGYRCDYIKPEPYPYPKPDYQNDPLYQYIKVHNHKSVVYNILCKF